MADLPSVTITLPQNVWQAVEDALVAQVSLKTFGPSQEMLEKDDIALLERAISAIKL